ncbi:MAG: undecaprenyl phosphate translocase family protein [Phycisphaeraceae bacterium]
MSEPQNNANPPLSAGLLTRAGFGGVLMGLANLVPGISGGTMLLATGIYPAFIEAVGDLSRLKWTRKAIVLVGVVVFAALVAVVALAGPIKDLVVGQRWIMYALFIGLTLGGVPTVWRLIRDRDETGERRRAGASVWGGAAVGLAAMIALVIVQSGGGGSGDTAAWWRMLVAGIAGASAMILPGLSGGYLLLVIGAYVPILAGIDAFTAAGKEGDFARMMELGWSLLLPVGLGVVIGVAVVSNALRWCLHRFRGATLGVLLGLLVGAVAGLYPFQEGVPPEPGDQLKGYTITKTDAGELRYLETGEPVDADDYPVSTFTPDLWQIPAALGLIAVGLGITLGIDWLGRLGGDRKGDPDAARPDAATATSPSSSASENQP